MAIQHESLDKVLSNRQQYIIHVALEYLQRNCLTSGVLKVEGQCADSSVELASILPDEVAKTVSYLFGENNAG